MSGDTWAETQRYGGCSIPDSSPGTSFVSPSNRRRIRSATRLMLAREGYCLVAQRIKDCVHVSVASVMGGAPERTLDICLDPRRRRVFSRHESDEKDSLSFASGSQNKAALTNKDGEPLTEDQVSEFFMECFCCQKKADESDRIAAIMVSEESIHEQNLYRGHHSGCLHHSDGQQESAQTNRPPASISTTGPTWTLAVNRWMGSFSLLRPLRSVLIMASFRIDTQIRRITSVYIPGTDKLGVTYREGSGNQVGDLLFSPSSLQAALAAIWERLRGDSAAALAAPPLSPPRRPSATAAGFLAFTTGGSVLGTSPIDSRKTRCANSLGSARAGTRRSGMMPSVWQAWFQSQRMEISN